MQPYEDGGWQKQSFLCRIWEFHVLSIKRTFSQITTNSLPIRVGVPKHEFYSFNAISNKSVFIELGPSFTCWRENLYHSWGSHFSITINRENKSCV